MMVQMKSLHQSQSATMRAHAVSAMSAQAELLRDVTDDAREDYERLLNQLNQGVGINQMNHYQKSILAVSLPCHTKSCNEEMFVRHQGLQIAKAAAAHGIRFNILPCNNQLGVAGENVLKAPWYRTLLAALPVGCRTSVHRRRGRRPPAPAPDARRRPGPGSAAATVRPRSRCSPVTRRTFPAASSQPRRRRPRRRR